MIYLTLFLLMMSGKSNMFLSDDQIERDTLKQGDIISQVHFLSAINIDSIQFTSSAANPDEYLS